MAMLKCENCGAPLEVQGGQRVVTCSYCGHKQAISQTDAEAFDQEGLSYEELLETTKALIAEGDFVKAKRFCAVAREEAGEVDGRADFLWLLIYGQAKSIQELGKKATVPLDCCPGFKKAYDLADSDLKEQLEKANEISRNRWDERQTVLKKKHKKTLLIVLVSVAAALLIGLGIYFYLTRSLLPSKNFEQAQASLAAGNKREAISFYASGKGIFIDEKLDALWRKTEGCTLSAGDAHAIFLKKDGKVLAAGNNQEGQCQVENWTDLVSVSAGSRFTLGLKKDGTCVAVGDNSMGQCEVSGWKDVMAISAGSNHSVALLRDGTCVAVGDNGNGQCNVKGWKDIVSISAGGTHTVGVKADGSVVATRFLGDFFDDEDQCDVQDWSNVIALAAGENHTSGLMKSGRFCFAGRMGLAYKAEETWTDLAFMDAGSNYVLGLRTDGSVLVSDEFRYLFIFDDFVPTDKWSDVAYVAAGRNFVVGVQKDGTVLFASKAQKKLHGLSEWKTDLSQQN